MVRLHPSEMQNFDADTVRIVAPNPRTPTEKREENHQRNPLRTVPPPARIRLRFPVAMPTYEYECERCGHHFEVFQSMKDAKLTDCPQGECVGPVRRLLGTGAGVIFKGSGFYETDYRSESYKQGAKKAEEQAKGASSTGDGGGTTSTPKETPAAAPAPAPAAAPAKTS